MNSQLKATAVAGVARFRLVFLWSLGFRVLGVWGLGFRILGVWGLGFRVLGVWGVGFRVLGVWGLGFRVLRWSPKPWTFQRLLFLICAWAFEF